MIKTALVSFGMSGRVFHAPFIHLNPNFMLAGAWERSSKNIQSVYPGVTSYASYEEILTDPSIDLVVVNSPNDTHFAYAKSALLAGKHVVVEKAFTVTAKDAEELDALATSKGLKLAVYGTLWIALLQLLFIVLTIMCFWYKIMIESKLHHFCINFYNHIFNLFKKYTQRRIGIESSSTTNHISIPMPVSTFKESKIICSVCYDNSVTLLLEPCNHICICNICYESLVTKECPICKTKIDVTRKVFFASPSCSN